MALRREGAALLVAGHGGPVAALDASAVHTLGQIGEALLATGASWQIRRLTAAAGERQTPDRATLKAHFDELASEPVRVAIVVVVGAIVELAGAPALVTGPQVRDYPEDATLPLAWIRDRVAAIPAEHVVVVVSATGDGAPPRWLGALGTARSHHVIAVDAPAAGHPLIDALLTGLCGDALDPRTGTVTLASLCSHVERLAPGAAVQRSTVPETFAQPPPLAGFWDVRRSQLAHRPRARPDEPEDLTGAVLPGRFRIDRLVARGTFGTVYRARQLAVERDVAVKVLHADIDPSSEDGRLFVHEIRSVGRIDHGGVVRIHQADITHDGRLFFAMELLDGSDLQQLGAAAVVPRARAVELVRQLLDGLGAAHDAGLVHADVKPANAIVVPRVLPAAPDDERVVLVDFGLARLRAPDRPAESAGGTPAYMAPEQLHEGRVDARSDLFSAALVLVFLLTGWRRPNARTLVPPFDLFAEDAALRRVLERALDLDPAKRYQTARELAAALTGRAPSAAESAAPPPTAAAPFRLLAPLTIADRDRLFGREGDLGVLIEHVLFRRAVVYTAPSGTGKTSLLCAGLIPRLEALGIEARYVRCRPDTATALAAELHPGATTLGEAIAARHQRGAGKLVLVVDQLEAALGDPAFLPALLGFAGWPAQAEVSIVLSVREDYLARLLAWTQELEPGMPIVRLPPLGLAGARAAILGPLAEARLAIEPELLDALLDDLARAGAAIGPELGWSTLTGVYPPHLQLACSVLYEALAPGEATLTLAHYRRLGGFDAIVGEHLERVLDTELSDGRDVIARDIFVALVTAAQERAFRPEPELLAIVGARHTAAEVADVLELLRARGLIVRVRGTDEPGWELVHDSLVKRVLAWIDARDLARRRAIELVRYHLRRSRGTQPSLLDRAELRELRAHAGAIEELDAEWQQRSDRERGELGWSPRRLVAESRQSLRRLQVAIAASVGLIAAALGWSVYDKYASEARLAAANELAALDRGRFALELAPYDWDAATQQRLPAIAAPPLTWTLHVPEEDGSAGAEFRDEWQVRHRRLDLGDSTLEAVDARGGPAVLVIERGACPPVEVAIARLPGLAHGDAPHIRVPVPTCAASFGDMVEIPDGRFMISGPGEPPSKFDGLTAQHINLPAFRIDRREVSNAAYDMYAAMSPMIGGRMRRYPAFALGIAGKPRMPASFVSWQEARAYCRYHGKRLVESREWTKAMRGGETLADGRPNPHPQRNLPWGAPISPPPAHIAEPPRVPPRAADIGTNPGDRSPDGVFDLGGNVAEWTGTPAEDGFRVIRGGNHATTLEHGSEKLAAGSLVDAIVEENTRAESWLDMSIGLRCAADAPAR